MRHPGRPHRQQHLEAEPQLTHDDLEPAVVELHVGGAGLQNGTPRFRPRVSTARAAANVWDAAWDALAKLNFWSAGKVCAFLVEALTPEVLQRRQLHVHQQSNHHTYNLDHDHDHDLDHNPDLRLDHDANTNPNTKTASKGAAGPTSTAWLDGLRGWAALLVVLAHLAGYAHPQIELCHGAAFDAAAGGLYSSTTTTASTISTASTVSTASTTISGVGVGVGGSGAGGSDRFGPHTHNLTPAALPILRLLFSGGHFAVMVFFVVSGYVVPRRLLGLLYAHHHQDEKYPDDKHHSDSRIGTCNHRFLAGLHDAVIRRPLRLFLPALGSTLLCPVLAWHVLPWLFPTLLVTSPSSSSSFSSSIFPLPWPPETWPPRLSTTLLGELSAWAADAARFVFVFRDTGDGVLNSYYNLHTWTLPVELRGSLLVYGWLFVTHTVGRRRWRVGATLGVLAFLLFGVGGKEGAWYAAFFAGLVLCEVEMLGRGGGSGTAFVSGKRSGSGSGSGLSWTTKDDQDTTAHPLFLARHPLLRAAFLHVALVAGLYLGGEPTADGMARQQVLGECRGWRTLGRWIPLSYGDGYRAFWLFWGAWITVAAAGEVGWVRRGLEGGWAQYLGRHSFALYLTHGPLTGLVTEPLFYATGIKRPPPSSFDLAASLKSNSPDDKLDPTRLHWVERWRREGNYEGGEKGWLDKGWPYGFEPEYWFCVAVSLVCMFYVAEMGTKMLDRPGVRVARAVARWVRGEEGR